MNAIRIITAAVATEFGVSPEDLIGKNSKTEIALPRHVVFYLGRQLTKMSYPVMARAFGKHHTTVMHSIRCIEAMRRIDSKMHCKLSELEARLQEPLKLALPDPAPPTVDSVAPKPHNKTPRCYLPVTAPPAPTPVRRTTKELIAAHRFQELKAYPFDSSDRPSAGTACRWCSEDGHWCAAQGFSGDHALCAACGTGKPCAQAEAVKLLHAGAYATERIPVSGLAPLMTVRRRA